MCEQKHNKPTEILRVREDPFARPHRESFMEYIYDPGPCSSPEVATEAATRVPRAERGGGRQRVSPPRVDLRLRRRRSFCGFLGASLGSTDLDRGRFGCGKLQLGVNFLVGVIPQPPGCHMSPPELHAAQFLLS